MATAWERPSDELAIPDLGQQALQLRGLGRGADARKGAQHGGRATGRFEEVPEQPGHRRLAVRPRDADRQEITGREPVERGGEACHDRADGPRGDERLDDRPIEKLGDEVLAEQAHGAPVDRLGGEGVAVAELSRHAAEEVPRHDAAAVVGDATNIHRCRIPGGLDDVDVVEEKVHLHSSHGRPHSEWGHGGSAPPASGPLMVPVHVMSCAWLLGVCAAAPWLEAPAVVGMS